MFKVLLVDDESFIRETLKSIIRWDAMGLELTGEASNGNEAFELCTILKPDIIITDMKMPLLDGVELLEKLQCLSVNIRIIVMSGYDSFKYTRSAILYGAFDYILKPIDRNELNNCLQKAVSSLMSGTVSKQPAAGTVSVNIIEEQTLSRLILFGDYSEEYISALPAITSPNEGFITASAAFTAYDYKKDRCLEGNYSYLNSIKVCIMDGIKGFDNIKLLEIPNKSNQFAIFISINNDLSSSPLNLAQNKIKDILHQASEAHDIKLFCGMGSLCKSFKEIHSSYISSKKALETVNLLSPHRFTLAAPDSFPAGSDMDSNHKHLFSNLSLQISKGKFENHFVYLDEFIRSLAIKKAANITKLKFVVKIWAEVLERAFNSLQLDHDEFYLSFMNRLDYQYDTYNINSIIDFLNKTKNDLEQLLIKDSLMSDINLIASVYRYVNENYTSDISLNSLSEKFFANGEYLSRAFKKKYGVNLVSYINHKRLEKAKELLLVGRLGINEIIDAVGFNDVSYFIKLFKKHYNMTPNQFRSNTGVKEN